MSAVHLAWAVMAGLGGAADAPGTASVPPAAASSTAEGEPEPVADAPPVEPPALRQAPPVTRPAERPDELVEVLLELEIDEQGEVVAATVIESAGSAFDASATAAARAFVFRPAYEGNVPIAVTIRYLYVFEPVSVPEPAASDDQIDDTETVIATPIEREPASSELGAARAERIPGTQGDAVKAARVLGGVARPSAAAGELSIWGAAVSDSRRYIDWMPVPRLFHFGGSRSVVPTPMVGSVALAPGGFGPAYGRAIGGNVHVHTRDPRLAADPHRWGGSLRVDTIDVGATADARVHDRAWVSLAVRRSILAQTYGAVVPESLRQLVPIPEYWDYQSKSVIVISARDRLEVVGAGSRDRVRRSIPSLTPDEAFSEDREAAFHRVGLRFIRTTSGGRTTSWSAWGGVDDDRWTQRFSQVRAESDQHAVRGGMRLDQRRRLADYAVLRWGLDLEVGHHANDRDGALTLPAREGDVVVFGQPPGDRVGRDTWGATQVGAAAYASVKFQWGQGRWSMEPGLRLEPLVVSGDRIMPVRPIEPEVGYTDVDLAVDPRLHVRWAPIEKLAVFAAGGQYHQAESAADLSPVFGNPRVRPARAYHAVAGAEAKPWRWLDLATTLFLIRGQRLVGRNPDPTPAVATVVLSQTEARNFGGQLTARAQPTDALFAMTSYSLMWAQRQDPGQTQWRRFDFDQTHGLTALAGWKHRSGLELSGRVTLASGNPRTAVVGAVANARTGGFDPIFAEHNHDRLPMFLSGSVQIAWGRRWSWGELRTWLDVQNVTNRNNAEERFYSSDFSSRGTVDGLPIVPVLGVQVRR